MMQDPVVCADGHTYERAAVARWLQERGPGARSPLTGVPLAHHTLVQNHALRNAIQQAGH